jgi:hypothetical protein
MTLFDKYCEVATKTGIDGIINMIDTWSPFKSCAEIFGENPTPQDFIDFYIDEYTTPAADIVNAGLYNQAVNLMDDTIREKLHKVLAPCDDAYFLAVYMAEHNRIFNEDFTI